jgi:hypothetical protein
MSGDSIVHQTSVPGLSNFGLPLYLAPFAVKNRQILFDPTVLIVTKHFVILVLSLFNCVSIISHPHS